MSADLEQARAFLRSLDELAATEIEPWAFGRGFWNPGHPLIWDANFLAVETPAEPAPDELQAEAERVFTARGLGHRRLKLGHGADETYAELRRRGWLGERLLLMAHRRPPGKEAAAEVRELDVSDPRFLFARRTYLATAPWTEDEAVARSLVELAGDLARLAHVRVYAAFVGGEVASYCELYSDGRTAQIEDVVTLESFRGRGLATAVVLHALAVARAEEHNLVFLVAEVEDWPRELYGRLGFDALGESCAVFKPRARPGGSEPRAPAP